MYVDATLSYKIGVYVGINAARPVDVEVATELQESFNQANIDFKWEAYTDNIGKAGALNDLYDKYSEGRDYIITMDNDMVFKMPWMHLIRVAQKIDFELMGFGSSTFWAHQPVREECDSYPMGEHRIYNMSQIAGGMLLFPRETLEKHKWTNKGGVYGFDDAQMCLDVAKKFVIFWGENWLHHDPLGDSNPDLKQYHDRKQHYFSQGQYILPKGWDT
jgi:hypothetical protein